MYNNDLKNKEYTSVVGNGVKTYKQLFSDLFNLVDQSKTRPQTILFDVSGFRYLTCSSLTSTYCDFFMINPVSGNIRIIRLQNNNGDYRIMAPNGTITDITNDIAPNGEEWRLRY